MTQSGARFVYVLYIRTRPEKLWDALTQPDFTKRYWAETWQESGWKTGSSWKLMLPDGRVGDTGKILHADSPRRLEIQWGVDFIPELKAEGPTRVTYELEPVGESVKLTFTQESPVKDSKVIDMMSTGWPHLFASMKSLLETGEPLIETTKWPEGM